ncbi:MAG TPA: transaldolase [Nitrolancea sp.]|nr:transaldolase [Nitrolancea sp.]
MMTDNPLRELEQCGQSVWLDAISRDLLRSGQFAHLIKQDGVSGVTANPSIFEKAIVGTHDYDESIRELARAGNAPLQIYEQLAIHDVGAAADLLRPTYERTQGRDGFASIEVSPDLAAKTEASIEEARRFWRELNRPNVMIKIPATAEGIPAIEALTAEGINVNITLIFAVEMYERVMEAYLRGLERRVEANQSITHIASVASFFVSRVDTLVDTLLRKRIDAAPDQRAALEAFAGTIAIANAKIAYQRFQTVFASQRFTALQAKGAQLQRPLWASTSTKNPAYGDTRYVASLIGPHTVNTMPLETIDAFRDHGAVDCGAVTEGLAGAQQMMSALERAGISMTTVTDELIREGVDKFCQALHSLLETIGARQGKLVSP